MDYSAVEATPATSSSISSPRTTPMELINLPKLTTEDSLAMPLAITTSQDKVLVALEAAAEA